MNYVPLVSPCWQFSFQTFSDAGGGIIDPGNACLGRRKTLLALLGLTVVFVVVLAVIVSSVGRSSDVIDVQDSVDAPKVAASRLVVAILTVPNTY